MRLRLAGLGRVVKRDLGIEFGREQLTSYGRSCCGATSRALV